MRNRVVIITCLALTAVITGLLWYQRSANRESTAEKQTRVIPTGETPREPAPDSPPPLVETVEAGRRSIASQQAAKRMNRPFAFYARAIDQTGAGVPGVTLSANVQSYDEGILIKPDDRVRVSKINVRSDGAGCFDIKQDRGAWLRIENVEKEGYVWQNPGFSSFGVGANAPTQVPSYASTNQRLTLHLWKKGTTEPVIQQALRVRLRAEQQEYGINLLTGQPTSNPESSDMIVRFRLVADTNGAARAHRLVSLDVQNGGIVETADSYPYKAPTAGYQPSWEWIYLAADTPPGRENWERNFYVKARNGQVYAGLRVKFDSLPMLLISVIANPAGSPVVEPDPMKRIADPEEIRRMDESTRVK